MDFIEALAIAKKNYVAFIEHRLAVFHGAPECDEFAAFGYCNGWFWVPGYERAIALEDINGESFDFTQGGWAYM